MRVAWLLRKAENNRDLSISLISDPWEQALLARYIYSQHPHNGALPFSVVLLYCNTAPRVLHFSALVILVCVKYLEWALARARIAERVYKKRVRDTARGKSIHLYRLFGGVIMWIPASFLLILSLRQMLLAFALGSPQIPWSDDAAKIAQVRLPGPSLLKEAEQIIKVCVSSCQFIQSFI